ncbi:MAG: replication protein [Pseudomonadota bacterium]
MKRSIPRSLVERALQQKAEAAETPEIPPLETKSAPPTRGAGSAWKSGALAQSQAAIDEARAALVDDILAGRHELILEPEQVTDAIGSDRRQDWREQAAFQSLVQSIEANGQDTPIVVLPAEPEWRPDQRTPTDVEGVPFLLMTGRRRHAAAALLKRPLRAVLASEAVRKSDHAPFEMLFLRFRENEAREDLGAFERLLSIGEMYEELKGATGKLTAVSFAKKVGVHESIVSRARTVFARQEEILNAFKNAYDLSFADLQKAISSLEKTGQKPTKRAASKLTTKRKIGSRNLSLTHQNGVLSVKAAGVPVAQEELDALGDLIADFLNKTQDDPPGQVPRIRST